MGHIHTADPTSFTSQIVDLRICGVWQPQADVLFDVCVVDVDAPSYCGHLLWATG